MHLTQTLACATAFSFGLWLLGGPATAEEHFENDAPDVPRTEAVEPETDQPRHEGQDADVPELDLTDEQREQIQEILAAHAQQMAQAYQLFQLEHLRVIGTEAMMVSALQDVMTDEQRQQFQERIDRRDREDRPFHRDTERQPPRAADRADDFDIRHEEPARPEGEINGQVNGVEKQPEERHVEAPRRRIVVFGVRLMPRTEDYGQIGLTDEQQARCEAIHGLYSRQLQQTSENLHALHNRMVQLEVAKLQAIEEALTDEQMEKLHEWRERTYETPEDEAEEPAELIDTDEATEPPEPETVPEPDVIEQE